ncbi:MAG: pilin [bacterium]|nr:pilin [bacterium]
MKFVLTLLLLIALAGAIIPSITTAVKCPPVTGEDNKLNLCYPSVGGLPLKLDMPIEQIVAWLYTFFVMISGLAAFVMIVWGGVKWMTSQGNPADTGDAKDKIKMALLGLLLVLSSFIILQIINPELTTLKGPSLPGIQAGAAGAAGDGVYLCKKEACVGDENEYWYFGKPQDVDDWTGTVNAIRIRGPFEITLFEKKVSEHSDGQVLYFTTSVEQMKGYWLTGDPAGFLIKPTLWNDNIKSFKVSKYDPAKGPTHKSPGITVPTENELDAVIFTLDRKNFEGRRSTKQFFSGQQSFEGIGSDVNSVLITEGDDAVRFWEKSTDEEAFNTEEQRICFNRSIPDITCYSFNYRFSDCKRNHNDMKDDIRGVEVISRSECQNPGQVDGLPDK